MNKNAWTCYEYDLYAMMLSVLYDQVWMCIVSKCVYMKLLLKINIGVIVLKNIIAGFLLNGLEI